jgi:hypothetical protein
MQFMATLSEWRNIRDCIETILAFSRQVIVDNWRTIAPIVYAAIAQYPHPLTRSARDFCVVVSVTLPEEDVPDFLQTVFDAFFKSSARSMRAIYPVIVAELSTARVLTPYMEPPINAFTQLAEDFDPSVRAAVIRSLHQIRQFYIASENSKREKDIMALFAALGKGSDPYVKAVWIREWEEFSETRSVNGQTSVDALTVSQSLRYRPGSTYGKGLNPFKGGIGKVIQSNTAHPVLAIPQIVRPKVADMPF